MKQLLVFIPPLLLLYSLAARSQEVQPVRNSMAVVSKDSLPSPSVRDSVLKKMRGTFIQTPGAQLQGFNPMNVVGTQYKADVASIKGSLGQLNPLNQHLGSIRLSNVSAVVSADYINGPVDSLTYGTTDYNSVNTQISGTLTVFNIPLNVGYQYQTLQGGGIAQSYTGTAFSFNKQAYTAYLASRLQGKFNPADYLPQQYLSIDKMKEEAMGDMQQDLSKVQQQYSGVAATPGLTDWKTVNETDASTLERMIVPDSLRRAASSNQVLLGQMQAKINSHETVDTAQYNKILAQNQELKGKEALFGTVMSYRQKWQASGLVQTIQKLEAGRSLALANVVKDPSVIGSLAKQNLSLNGVEKIFADMSQFNVGRSVADMSPMTLSQSVFQNGLGSQLTTGNQNSVGVTGGQMPSQASGYEQLFSGNAFNPSQAMAGLNLGKGSQQENGSSMTLNTFKSTAASGLSGMLPFGSGGLQSFVLTFSKSLKIGAHGHVTLEFSKSLATGGSQGSSEGLLSTNDFFKTLGVSVDYTNEYPKLNLTQELTLTSAATDYANPGNAYMFSGMKQVTSSLQKSFLNKQLTVTLRDSYTSFVTDPTVNAHFLQNNHLLDARWKMKKGNYVSLKYQPSWSVNVDSGMHTNVGMIQRVAVDLNYNKKLGKRQLHTFTSLAFVNNTFQDSILSEPPLTVHSLQLTSMVSMSIKSCQVYLNNSVVYTPQSSAYVYLNSTWTTEGGYMYPLGSRLQATSALNYVTVTDWYKQVGIKQSLSGALSSHFSLTTYVDLARNIAIYQPYPVPTVRGNIMLSYHL